MRRHRSVAIPEHEEGERPARPRRPRRRRKFRGGLGCLLGLVAAVVGYQWMAYRTYRVPDAAMEPTLHGPTAPGGADLLRVSRLSNVLGPGRGQIWVYQAADEPGKSQGERELVGRVLAGPGDTIQVTPGRLLVDGRVAVQFTGDADALPIAPAGVKTGGDPAASVHGNMAELEMYYGNRFRLLAVPNPKLRYDVRNVAVNGRGEVKIEVEDNKPEEGIVAEPGLADFGGDPTLKATVFVAASEPRLIVVDGSQVQYDPGHVLVNSKPLTEPYAATEPRYEMPLRKLGNDEYWVLPDNRGGPGKRQVAGAVRRSRFVGRATFRLQPWRRLGGL